MYAFSRRSTSTDYDATIDGDILFDQIISPGKLISVHASGVSSVTSSTFESDPGLTNAATTTTSTNSRNTDDDDVDVLFDQISKKIANVAANLVSKSSSTKVTQNGTNAEVDDTGEKENRSKNRTNQAERITKKQKKAEERAAKQTANEINKIYKPAECMKYIRIQISASLSSEWYMADLKREADAAHTSVFVSDEVLHRNLITWTRRVPLTLAADENRQLELRNPYESCDRALLIERMEDIAPLVSDRQLTSHVERIKELAHSKMTLVVFGVKSYFKKKSANKITNVDLEMAIADLKVSASCDTRKVDTTSELALYIVQITKAIAEAPYKKAKRAYDEQADFYMRGDNKKCVSVNKDGHGLSRLWQQMIAILPLSSLETARTVCAQYRSPVHLYEAMQAPNSMATLADIGVDRAGIPCARARRVGPEFAKKLKILFTADDGDMLVE